MSKYKTSSLDNLGSQGIDFPLPVKGPRDSGFSREKSDFLYINDVFLFRTFGQDLAGLGTIMTWL